MAANRYQSGGKYGKRKKPDGSIYEEKDYGVKVRNSKKLKAFLDIVTARHKQLTLDLNNEQKLATWIRLHDNASDPNKQFSVKRIEEKVEKYIQNKNRTKPLNTLQKKRGYEITPMIAGRVPFGKLKKDRDMANVHTEMKY